MSGHVRGLHQLVQKLGLLENKFKTRNTSTQQCKIDCLCILFVMTSSPISILRNTAIIQDNNALVIIFE